MGHTFSNILMHVIFSTKDRRPIIDEALQEKLRAYMAGVARHEFGWAKRIGGTEDHLHGLLQIRPDVSVAHAMNRWKSLSSGWVHKSFPERQDFAWQAGYGAFSVSPSKAAEVIRYIDNQPAHHKRRTFKEEFLEFLDRHGVSYDPERVFE